MTRQHAKRILDAARAGEPISEASITAALVWSGDISLTEARLQRNSLPAGTWERRADAPPAARATWASYLVGGRS